MAWQVKISDNATVEDTVNLIRNTVLKESKSQVVANIVNTLKAKSTTDESFFKNLFAFACKNVKYLRDPEGHERIYTPERLLREGMGDCKKFSTLIGAVLVRAGYKPVLKIVSYDNNTWAHIYIIVPVKGDRKYITLDPVNKELYDKEVDHKKAWLHSLSGENMELSLLGKPSGDTVTKGYANDHRNDPDYRKACARMFRQHRINVRKGGNASIHGLAGAMLNDFAEISGEPPMELLGELMDNTLMGLSGAEEQVMRELMGLADDSLSGEEMLLGAYQDDSLLGRRKKRKGKVWGFMKKIGIAPARVAFMAMLRVNLFGFAKRAYLSWKKDNGKAISKLWKKLGGNPKKFKQTMMKGVKRLLAKGKLKGPNEYDAYMRGLGVAPLAAVAAVAVPIMTAMMSLFKKQGVVSKDNPEDVQAVQAVDQQEQVLEQQIDSGQAEQVVNQVQSSSGYANASTEEGGEQVSGLGSLEGLGKLDLGNLFTAIKSVVKAVKPTLPAAVKAVKQIKVAAQKAKNPKAKTYLNNQANKATAALQVATKGGNPEAKNKAGQQVVEILNEVSDAVQQTVNAAQAPAAGSIGGYFDPKSPLSWFKLAGYVGFIYSNQQDNINKVLDYLTNLF